MERGDYVMDRFKVWFKRWALWIALVAVAAILAGRGQVESEKLADTVEDVAVLTVINNNLVTSLQAAVVDSCKENGNASRQVARETLKEEISDASNIDPALKAAFNLPPAKLQQLIDENVSKLRLRLSRVHPVNCVRQYQISPGSGERRQDRLDSSLP